MSSPVAPNLKRAYRDPAPQDLPEKMAELLRELQEQDKERALAK